MGQAFSLTLPSKLWLILGLLWSEGHSVQSIPLPVRSTGTLCDELGKLQLEKCILMTSEENSALVSLEIASHKLTVKAC